MQQDDPIRTAKLGALVDQVAFSERLGGNSRYAAIGNAMPAGVMGICAYFFGDRAVFLSAAALAIPALAALAACAEPARRRSGLVPLPWPGVAERSRARLSRFLTDRGLIAFCCFAWFCSISPIRQCCRLLPRQ